MILIILHRSHCVGVLNLTVDNSHPSVALSTELQLAIEQFSEELDETERDAFKQANKAITLEEATAQVKKLEESDSTTVVRRGGNSLGPALKIIQQCMNIVSIIPQGAEISSLIVGGLKVVIGVSFRDCCPRIKLCFGYGSTLFAAFCHLLSQAA